MIDNDLKQLVTTSQMKTGNNWGTGMLIIHPVTGKLLLGKRTDTHNFCSPGGKVEIGESPLQGVLRETKEESNITVNSCEFYDYEMHTAENGKNWISFMFVSTDFDESTIQNQKSEVEPWDWYSVEEALDMNLFPPTRKSIERAISAGVINTTEGEHEECCDNCIPFVEMPTTASGVQDSCCCSYSYSQPEEVFTTHQGLYWD